MDKARSWVGGRPWRGAVGGWLPHKRGERQF